MDPLTRILMLLARWFRRPPSPQQMKVMLAALVICLGIVALERLYGFPEWLTPHRVPILRHAP